MWFPVHCLELNYTTHKKCCPGMSHKTLVSAGVGRTASFLTGRVGHTPGLCEAFLAQRVIELAQDAEDLRFFLR